MKTAEELKAQLEAMHRKSYPAYKSLQGAYRFKNYILSIDHVQGDPFAAPSKLRILIDTKKSGFPPVHFDLPERRIALEDHLVRLFDKKISLLSYQAGGSGKSGLLNTSHPGPEILERSACHMGTDSIEVRFEAGFPANGRSIDAAALIKILFDFLPPCIWEVFYYENQNAAGLSQITALADDQAFLRKELESRGLAAFVANGSVLPRESGVSGRPLKNAIPFQSPPSLEIELVLPHKGKIRGMGLPRGITLIVGGGYHGKSTLLKSLELGVYNHIKEDGREYVVTDRTAVKLRAEDGRSVAGVDISAFINHLPNQKDTLSFCTEDASGSTSQAANTMEALEAGSTLFLIDEDTSATNFMVRDELMQLVVHRDKEPITPFNEMIRPLYEQLGVSTVLAAGSSGAYFYFADRVIQMDSYKPLDITDQVRQICQKFPLADAADSPPFPSLRQRVLKPAGGKSPGGRENRVKIKVFGKDSFQIDKEDIDLRCLEQLADREQTAALAYFLNHLLKSADGKKDLGKAIEEAVSKAEAEGFSFLSPDSYLPCAFSMPRRQELFACLSRYRRLAGCLLSR